MDSKKSVLSGLTFGLVLLLGASAFAAGRVLETLGTPLLRFGVVSDIHITVEDDGTVKPRHQPNLKRFASALRDFDKMKVDAVVIAGDMANCGRVAELEAVGCLWDEVFPNNRAADGRPVEKVFIYGNHDPGKWESVNKNGERLIADDLAGSWEKAFHEPFKPAYVKTVKGYDFVGVHWGNEGKTAAVSAIDEAGKKGRLFFHVQHPHVKNTVYGGNVWGQDNGAVFKTLAKYPQAVSFSGHSHMPLENEQSVWQGEFTALGTASLCYLEMSSYRTWPFPRGYENGPSKVPAAEREKVAASKLMANEQWNTGHGQGYLVSVYADRVVFTRREFVEGVQVGEDWVLPLDGTKPLSLAERVKRTPPPGFPADAKLSITQTEVKKGGKKVPALQLDFPSATGAYEYQVFGTGADGNPVESWVYASKQKVVLDPGRFADGKAVFEVFPVDSLGQRGKALKGVRK